MKRVLLIAVTALALAACSDEDKKAEAAAKPQPSPAQISAAVDMLPADPALSEVYERSCMSCHSMVESKAPITGHVEGWQYLIDQKGMAGLLASAKNGLNAMPARGFCADCSDDQFTALIRFMAGQEK